MADLPTGAGAAAQPKMHIADLLVSEEYEYEVLAPDAHVLVPTCTRVQVDGVDPRMTLVNLHPAVLPWGFVDRIQVQGEALPDFRVHVSRTTGARQSRRLTPVAALQGDRAHDRGAVRSATVSLVRDELAIDQDAADELLAALPRQTGGHCLLHRMVNALTVVNVGIEFYGPPPAEFSIVYYGASTLLPGACHKDAADRTRRRLGVQFGHPPVTPAARSAAARAALEKGLPTS
jgi:hypothetical protein